MDTSLPSEDHLEVELEKLRNLEAELNRRVREVNPQNRIPCQLDWPAEDQMRWRKQKLLCEKLQRERRNAHKGS